MTRREYRCFEYDLPSNFECFETEHELVIVAPHVDGFQPNLVVRVEPWTSTLTELAQRALRSTVDEIPTAVVVGANNDPSGGLDEQGPIDGPPRRRFTTLILGGDADSTGPVLIVTRDLMVAGELALDITATSPLAEFDTVAVSLLQVAASFRPRQASAHASAPAEDLTWLGERTQLAFGDAARRMPVAAVSALESIMGGGRLFAPRLAPATEPMFPVLREAGWIDNSGRLSASGKALQSAMRSGRPWLVRHADPRGEIELRGWCTGSGNLSIIPLPDDPSNVDVVFTPAVDAIRQICGWSRATAAWPVTDTLPDIALTDFMAKCLQDQPLPQASGVGLAAVPWRLFTLTNPGETAALSWISTPLGAARVDTDADTRRVSVTPFESALWLELVPAWQHVVRS